MANRPARSRMIRIDARPDHIQPLLTQKRCLDVMKATWKSAKLSSETDLIAVVVEGTFFGKKIRDGETPGSASFSSASAPGVATACASLLSALKETEMDRRLGGAVELLREFIIESRRKT